MGIIQAVVFAIGYVVLAGILAIVLSIKKYKEKKAKTLSSEISQS